ncbi:MAG: hypothetical protein M3O23_06555 [Actinomycetota bacterium]|nr:hypothetical protein [Actinomycetota bacterium]
MATTTLTPDEVVVHLTTVEKIGSLHRDLHLPRAAVTAAEVVDEPLTATRGLRSPGLAVPGRVKGGTWRSPTGRQFVAVRGGRRAVRLHLTGHRYASVLAAADDADAVAAALGSARRPRPGS